MNLDKEKKSAIAPKNSVWVSASAGTGKTTILVARLLRLFLSGVAPSKILCLTYTNAGASEMKERILSRAKSWVGMDSGKLQAELLELFEDDEIPQGDEIQKLETCARGLFSKLVDSPLPLKIYTIHAFCESILKRFPLEAGVSPHFDIIEGTDAAAMVAEAWRRTLSDMREGKDEEAKDALYAFAALTMSSSEKGFGEIRDFVLAERRKYSDLLEQYRGVEAVADALFKRIFNGVQGAVPELARNPELYLMQAISRIPENAVRAYMAEIEGDNLDRLQKFFALDSEKARAENFDLYGGIFITKDGSVRKKFPHAELAKAQPRLAEALRDEAARVAEIKRFMGLSEVYVMSVAALRLALLLQKNYAALKREACVSDFDDLIEQVRRLFRRPDISAWILYKLDGGISHVLIDEAQDTSPVQWELVDVLTEHFFDVGKRADELKSFFSVGDRKQSIFAFQGADVRSFDAYHKHFRSKVESGGFPFKEVPLVASFRSGENILSLVDAAFQSELRHVAKRGDYKGYVEIMPLAAREKDAVEHFFRPPVEDASARSAVADLSEAVAEKISGILAGALLPNGDGSVRKASAGDIIVLVQRRSSARYLERKLKERGIPTAGRDKVELGSDIAAADLMSLLKFCVAQSDDLSLCEVLKSPLFGLSDDDLFELCFDRGEKSVYRRLEENGRFAVLAAELDEIIAKSREENPHLFFDFVLHTKGGRAKFVARMGDEAADVLDDFFEKTLEYDRAKIGKSLLGFAAWFEGGAMESKRGALAGADAVRIMTVHGSKGLEAPIVFLFDANLRPAPLRAKIIWSGGLPIYKSDLLPEVAEAEKLARQEEFYRLMYVAMTRARDRLYVCGWESGRGENEQSWYNCIAAAAKSAKIGDDVPEGKLAAPVARPKPDAAEIPEFFKTPISSDLTAAPFKPRDNAKGAAVERGKILHELFEKISKNGDWESLARRKLERQKCENPDGIIDGVRKIFSAPSLAFIFENPSRREVEFATKDGIIRIDRIVDTPRETWIIDYKSDAKKSRAYDSQLEKYASALKASGEKKPIRKAILWTSFAELEEV